MVLLTVLAHAQGQEWNYRVVDVVVSGNRVATSSLILGVSAIDKGSPLNPAQVQETIRRLYGLGMFSDVSIDAEQVTGGIRVIIHVKELPKLTGLSFSGNQEIKSKTLTEKLKLGVGGYISPYLIEQKQEEIRQLYSEKGYFQAVVRPELTYNADSTGASLKYAIDERSKVKVRQVILTGNKQVKANDIIKVMRNRKRGFLKSSTFAKDKYDEDLEKIIDEYHKKGYIDAYLISDSNTIDTALNQMTIYLDVYEGPLYYFGTTTFKGNEELKTPLLESLMKYKEGMVFSSDQYDKSLTEIYTTYQEIGHLHIRVDDSRTTRQDSILDITFDITEGLPSHIGLVKIVGNTKTKDRVIRRELSVLPGQVFNRSLLIRSIRDVMALNYFSNAEPTPIDLPNGDVDLELKVQEKQTGQISAGAGYNSQDGLVGNIGLGIPNLAGNGQNLAFTVERGKNRNSLSVSFTEPWLFSRPTLLGTELYSTNRRWLDDTYTEGRRGGSIRLGRRLRWPDNYFRVYASYRLEQDRFNDFSDAFRKSESYYSNAYRDTTQNRPAGTGRNFVYFGWRDQGALPGSVLNYDEQWFTSSQVALTISRDSRNLPEFATKGSQLSYTFEKNGGFLGGYWHYDKHTINVAKFFPIIGKMALAAKIQYSVITSPDGDNRILLSDRFYPGGTAFDGIVRGYDDGTLTPDSLPTPRVDTVLYYFDRTASDPNATPDSISTGTVQGSRVTVRGKYLLVTNFELQIPLASQQLYGLLFFDAGNSWLYRRTITGFGSLYKGVGVGFRIVVPGIGTIGFDFGYPLNKKLGQTQKIHPHFQIGTTFR
ncbi:outer membrane protein assembly factor BamA [candidate division GN15 bacterium]|uniref:Outer membrane protein assembly factor BamA n=1 Tax=candidate division GN15 bacterium TaxID=2072418 RepID=A0A855XCF3_9BACT|nr:MAG: outer membrane protein assembly factor BamA [candidate division GN15 bacterium]